MTFWRLIRKFNGRTIVPDLTDQPTIRKNLKKGKKLNRRGAPIGADQKKKFLPSYLRPSACICG
jgi:hypothetical protein